jgi:CxxC motif-containing protein
MKQLITCISCPVGCRMEVETQDGKVVSITGNGCKRGEVYGRQESVAPQRMVTAVVPVQGRPMPLSVKTKTPIPKKDIACCMRQIHTLKLVPPIRMGQVVLENVCGSGVPVIATKTVE